MNHLNSVLLEGDVIVDPAKKDDGVYFEIESHKFKKQGEVYVKLIATYGIKTYGKQASLVLNTLKAGRGVRIVGRLESQEDQEGKYNVLLIADHIEFKTTSRKDVTDA